MWEQSDSVGRLDRVDGHALLGLLVVQRVFLLEGERGGRAAPEPRHLKPSGVSFCYFVDGASGFCGLFGAAARGVSSQMGSCGTASALFCSPRSRAFIEMDASPGPLLLRLEVPLGADALRELLKPSSPPSFSRHPHHTGIGPALGGASRCRGAASDEVMQRDARSSDLDHIRSGLDPRSLILCRERAVAHDA